MQPQRPLIGKLYQFQPGSFSIDPICNLNQVVPAVLRKQWQIFPPVTPKK